MSYPGSTDEIVTLAEVKSLNGITAATYDTYISAIIPVICRAVETYCRRRFVKSNWIQWIPKQNITILDNWPINNVLLIGAPYGCFTINDTTNLYTFNLTQPTSTNPNIVSKFVATNTSTLVSTEYLFSTYPTVGALKTAVETGLAGVTFTYETAPSTITFANCSTLSLRMTTGKTVYVGVNYFDQTSGTTVGDIYRISDDSDRIIFNPNYLNLEWFDAVEGDDAYDEDRLVIYNAGYTTADMPQELKWIVSAIIQDLISIYGMQGNGLYAGAMKSETLGDYTYILADGASINNIIDRYASQLDYWKKKCI